jgi:hypothetical protein
VKTPITLTKNIKVDRAAQLAGYKQGVKANRRRLDFHMD